MLLTNYFNRLGGFGKENGPYILLMVAGTSLSILSQKIGTEGVLWLGRNVLILNNLIGKNQESNKCQEKMDPTERFNEFLQKCQNVITSKPKLCKSLELLVPSTVKMGSDHTTIYLKANYHEKILTIFSRIFITPLVLTAFLKAAQYIAQQAGKEFKKDSLFTTSAFFKYSAIGVATHQLYHMIKGHYIRFQYSRTYNELSPWLSLPSLIIEP